VAARNAKSKAQPREVPQAVVIAAIVLIVVALAAGGFYAYNGGWKTAGQQQEEYKHELLPLMAAKHGDTEALEAENKLRKDRGQPALELPKGKQSGRPMNDPERLRQLQQQMAGHAGQ
jgi:hypothetical protein